MKHRAARSLSEQRRAKPLVQRGLAMGEGTRTRSRRRIWLLLGGLVAGAALIWSLRPQRVDLEALGDADACGAAARCVVVYLAPWAPATERSMGTVKRIVEESEALDLQVAVVVGADEPEAMEDLAARLPGPAILDEADVARGALDVETVPTWYMLDASHKITHQVDGTFFPFSYHAQKLGL